MNTCILCLCMGKVFVLFLCCICVYVFMGKHMEGCVCSALCHVFSKERRNLCSPTVFPLGMYWGNIFRNVFLCETSG